MNKLISTAVCCLIALVALVPFPSHAAEAATADFYQGKTVRIFPEYAQRTASEITRRINDLHYEWDIDRLLKVRRVKSSVDSD